MVVSEWVIVLIYSSCLLQVEIKERSGLPLLG